jgi:hypothetical protein
MNIKVTAMYAQFPEAWRHWNEYAFIRIHAVNLRNAYHFSYNPMVLIW